MREREKAVSDEKKRRKRKVKIGKEKDDREVMGVVAILR